MKKKITDNAQEEGGGRLRNFCVTVIAESVAHSRVEAGAGVLGLLYEAGHVLEEEVVHVLLVHVAQLRVAAHVHLQQTRW